MIINVVLFDMNAVRDTKCNSTSAQTRHDEKGKKREKKGKKKGKKRKKNTY